jgi:hypothetical protein
LDFVRAVFRDETVAYYLVARKEPMRAASALPASVPREDKEGPVALRAVDATAAGPWDRHIGTGARGGGGVACPLDDGRISPQAAEFRFRAGPSSSRRATRRIGSFVGEGDEVLVFSEEAWARRRHETCTGRPLSVVWRGSGGGAD